MDEFIDTIHDGIDVVEDLANGDGVAYWEDAEAFFRAAAWSLIDGEFDLR